MARRVRLPGDQDHRGGGWAGDFLRVFLKIVTHSSPPFQQSGVDQLRLPVWLLMGVEHYPRACSGADQQDNRSA